MRSTHELPGWIELVAVSGNGGSLWTLEPGDASAPVDFVGRAEESWRDAALAVPRSIPLLARPFAAHARTIPRARHLASYVARGHVIPERVLGDRSFGLAFALSLVSSVTGVALPRDTVATATVDAYGRLGGVRGLETKALCLRAKAPHVRRLLVGPGHRDEELAVARAAGLHVVTVSHVREAIALVLPTLGETLARQATDGHTREELVETLFRLAVDSPHESLVSWRAVADAAEHVLAALGPTADAWTSWRLAAARAFARRHVSPGEVPPCPWPAPEALLHEVPPPLRQYAMANIIQHATDCGSPSAEEVVAWAEAAAAFPPTEDAFPAHLRVLGARARLWAVTGRPAEALIEQEALTGAWLARREVGEVSYPLCEWFRLAGALVDRDAYERAVEALERARAIGDLGPNGEAFVAADRGRAAALLGRTLEAEEVLIPGPNALASPNLLALMTVRTRALLARSQGNQEEAKRLRGGLGRGDPDQALTGLFIDLDVALQAGEMADAVRLLEELTALQPQTVGHLTAVLEREGRTGDAPAYVARFYPY